MADDPINEPVPGPEPLDPLEQKDICTLIEEALLTSIVENCQTPFSEDDVTRANQVQIGHFQDDPSNPTVVVCIHRNDPRKIDQFGLAAMPDQRYQRELGMAIGAPSPEYWTRRFSVEIRFWPASLGQDIAERANGVVVARVRHTITMTTLNLRDPFGEAITQSNNPITQMQFDEGGGPPDEYSWRTWLFLEYQTLWTPALP
jgi:hypothetical protein